MATNVLILGGTSEANQLTQRLLGDPRFAVTLSLAGRTSAPALPAVSARIGGFGGPEGLAAYLRLRAIDVLVDATHPFAGRISVNAETAARLADVPLIALERPAWRPEPGDRWTMVADLGEAPGALPEPPARVFLAVGRQSLAAFAAKPQHHYLIRVIDPPTLPAALTDVEIIAGRGPFQLDGEIDLLRARRIQYLVSKNSGGDASYAKLAAARALGLPVIMVERPKHAWRASLATLGAVVDELGSLHGELAKRSV